MRLFKPKFWGKNHANLTVFLLLPISIILQKINLIKNKLIKEKNFNVPIICVGNIFVGGTGKTPIAMKLHEILIKLGKKPAIIKKFYKNQFDEVNLIQKNNKNVFSKASRIEAIDAALLNKFNTMILDDGLQDKSIKKNLKIICFNNKQLIGNGFTLPAGPLREPFSSIKYSQIIIINGNQNKKFESEIKKISEKISIYYSKYIPSNLNNLQNKNFLAFAGIGNPENFFQLLNDNNISVNERKYFPDHHIYSKKEIDNLNKIAHDKNLELLTTEKDYYRLIKLGYNNINYVKIDVKIFNEEKLINQIKKCLF
jgi:tetraacyldisaccharide 4'-kinase